MTEALKTKGEIWREAHAHRTECPDCGKFVTLRTLRWKHVCGERVLPRRLLDERAARARLEQLEELAREAHGIRMKERNGSAGGERRADQGALGGAGQAGA